MGKIVGAHGVKGVVKVFSYAESASSFESGSSVFLEIDGREDVFTIEWAKPRTKTILMSLEGVSNRNQAEALAGSEIFIERQRLDVLEEGAWYWSDIIGLSVYTVENEYLGCVTSVIQTGSNDVYVVKNEQGQGPVEILVPALEWVVRKIDVDQRVMCVDLPEGLRDL